MCQGSGSLNGPELPSIIMHMISDLDIFRSANVLVKRHGQDAPIEAALGQDFTPSPTARRVQAGSSVRARSARKGARVDSSRPYVA